MRSAKFRKIPQIFRKIGLGRHFPSKIRVFQAKIGRFRCRASQISGVRMRKSHRIGKQNWLGHHCYFLFFYFLPAIFHHFAIFRHFPIIFRHFPSFFAIFCHFCPFSGFSSIFAFFSCHRPEIFLSRRNFQYKIGSRPQNFHKISKWI